MLKRLLGSVTAFIAAGLGFLLLGFLAWLLISLSTPSATSVYDVLIKVVLPYWLELLLGGYAALAVTGLVTGKVRPGLRTPALVTACLCTAVAALSLTLHLV